MSKVTQLTHENEGAGTEKGHGPWGELHTLFAELPPLRAMAEPAWYIVEGDELHFDGTGQGDNPSRSTDNFKAFALKAARELGLSDWRDWLDHLAQSRVAEVVKGPGRTKITDAARASADLCRQYALNGPPERAPLPVLTRSDIRALIEVEGTIERCVRKTEIPKKTLEDYIFNRSGRMNRDKSGASKMIRLARYIKVDVSQLPTVRGNNRKSRRNR